MSRKKGPCSGGPRARRSFTPGQKLDLLARYEQAVAEGEGGAFLRREGLYSSLMSEWRRARDAGLLQGKPAGETVGRPSSEQAEIARLRRELERTQAKLARTRSPRRRPLVSGAPVARSPGCPDRDTGRR